MTNIEKRGLVTLLILGVVILVILFCVFPSRGQVGVQPVESKPLTKVGQMALRQINSEITEINEAVVELRASELAQQHLSEAEGWTLDVGRGQMSRYPVAKAEPVPEGKPSAPEAKPAEAPKAKKLPGDTAPGVTPRPPEKK